MKKVKRNWQFLIENPREGKFEVTDEVKEFIDKAKQEYEILLHKGDYIWIKPYEVGFLFNDSTIKFIGLLYKQGAISDLYLPIEVTEEADHVITTKVFQYASESAALDDAMKNPARFKKSVMRFKMNDWNKFNEICDRIQKQSGNANQISFDEATGVIMFKKRMSELPFKKIEYYIAKALFEKPPETKFTEDDLIKHFDSLGSKADSPSRIYDAVLRINRRAQDELGIEKLIGYKGSHYWLNKTP